MSAIFISYRREDTEESARALYESLLPLFGRERLFMDVEAITLGFDFRDAIERSLSSCGVFLVIIGPQWLDIKAPNSANGPRRLDDPTDYVRQEIATGLKKGSDLPVIPVLVRGATMPTADQLPDDLKSLAYRSSLTLSHLDWEGNVQKLVTVIRKFVGELQNNKQAIAAPPADPILDRLEDQIAYYDRKSARCQLTYKRIKVVEISAACIIPVLATMQLTPYTYNYFNLRLALAMVTAFLGVLIVILEGAQQTNRYQEIWLTYRDICEKLKREKFTYLAGAGVYAVASNPRSSWQTELRESAHRRIPHGRHWPSSAPKQDWRADLASN